MTRRPACLLSAASVHPSIFTGKERDSESGNDYFGARYYASSMGRWLSPDWASHPMAVPYAQLGNPQSLNLYSYLLNNPLAGVDADGHCPQQQSGSSGCPDVHVSATKDADPHVMHDTPPGRDTVKVGTTVTIKVTDGDGKPIAGAGVKESPTVVNNLTGKPVDGTANPGTEHTASDGTTPPDVVATNVIKEGEATDQEIKDHDNSTAYDRTITQNLAITTTGRTSL